MGLLVLFVIVILILIALAINDSKKQKELHTKLNSIKKHNKRLNNLEVVKIKNSNWEKEWNKLVSYSNKAKKLEIEKEFEKAITEHTKAYEFGHNSKIINLNNYAKNIKRIIILLGKIKKHQELKIFLEKTINQYPQETEAKDWIVRLSKVNAKIENKVFHRKPIEQTIKTNIYSKEKTSLKEINNLGKMISNFKESLPEFDFYHNKPDNISTLEDFRNKEIPLQKMKEYRFIREEIKTILARAKILENNNNYTEAIDIYNKMISQNLENKEPHNRLMIIYRKLKQTNEEIRTIKKSISFFENLKNNQKEYVLFLAKKYNKEDFALEYINNNKRIQYYGGAFDLYNPNTDIEKWKNRLNKIQL